MTGKKKCETSDKEHALHVEGTCVNGHSDDVTLMSRDTSALPLDHVPNKVYMVGHGSALHRMVHSKVNPL